MWDGDLLERNYYLGIQEFADFLDSQNDDHLEYVANRRDLLAKGRKARYSMLVKARL